MIRLTCELTGHFSLFTYLITLRNISINTAKQCSQFNNLSYFVTRKTTMDRIPRCGKLYYDDTRWTPPLPLASEPTTTAISQLNTHWTPQ